MYVQSLEETSNLHIVAINKKKKVGRNGDKLYFLSTKLHEERVIVDVKIRSGNYS